MVGIALTFSVDTSGCERFKLISLMNNLQTKFQEEMAHETLRDLVWWYKWQHQLRVKPHEWEAVPKRTLIRWSASGRRHQSEVIDVSQVVRLGDTEETDGGPLRLDTHEELCALETFLTRESDAQGTVLKFILLHSPGNETHRADIGHLLVKAHFSPVGRGQAG